MLILASGAVCFGTTAALRNESLGSSLPAALVLPVALPLSIAWLLAPWWPLLVRVDRNALLTWPSRWTTHPLPWTCFERVSQTREGVVCSFGTGSVFLPASIAGHSCLHAVVECMGAGEGPIVESESPPAVTDESPTRSPTCTTTELACVWRPHIFGWTTRLSWLVLIDQFAWVFGFLSTTQLTSPRGAILITVVAVAGVIAVNAVFGRGVRSQANIASDHTTLYVDRFNHTRIVLDWGSVVAWDCTSGDRCRLVTGTGALLLTGRDEVRQIGRWAERCLAVQDEAIARHLERRMSVQ